MVAFGVPMTVWHDAVALVLDKVVQKEKRDEISIEIKKEGDLAETAEKIATKTTKTVLQSVLRANNIVGEGGSKKEMTWRLMKFCANCDRE